MQRSMLVNVIDLNNNDKTLANTNMLLNGLMSDSGASPSKANHPSESIAINFNDERCYIIVNRVEVRFVAKEQV